MQWTLKILLVLQVLTKRLSLCQLTGFICGALAGLILMLHFIQLGSMPLVLAGQEFWTVVLAITAFCWLTVIIILCAFCRYTFSSVAAPSLINCLLTCTITTWLTNYFQQWLLAWLIGMIVGLLIGSILCRLSQLLKW